MRSTMLPLMRRLLLAEVVGNQWMVAVGGSQGAGKTTLVRTLYDLQGEDARWLEPNEGRGEQLPILIQEDAQCNKPQGVLRRFFQTPDGSAELRDEPVSIGDFARATRGDDAQVMLPILKVPRRLFQHNQQALMLLPGYEALQRDNRVWQETMRLTLVGAAGCIIVTDPTRLANRQQGEIQRDLLPEELRASRPLVVVTKTEGSANNPQRQQELRDSAAKVFFPEEEGATAASRVLCVGADDPDYVQRWRPQVEQALRDLSAGSGADRQLQLARLAHTLDLDLGRVLNLVNSRAALHLHGTGAESTPLQAFLRTYDESVEDLRSSYQQTIRQLLEQQAGKAWQQLEQRLGSDYEGLGNKFRHLLATVSETHIRLRDDVVQAWSHPGELLPQYVEAMRELSGPKRPSPQKTTAVAIGNGPAPTALHQLGYVDAQGKAVARSESGLTDKKVQTNLHVLLQGRTELGTTERAEDTLQDTVQLLPKMALEYSRVAAALPALIHLQGQSTEVPQADVLGTLQQVEQQLGQFSETSRSLLKGLGAMLAIDVAADGHLDLINAIGSVFGLGSTTAANAAATATTVSGPAVGTVTTVPAAAATGASTVATAAVGVVAIGFIAYTAIQEVRRHDSAVRQVSQAMLDNIHDQHMVHFMTRFDDLMRHLRRHLESRLRHRYRLDQHLMEHDRLACALADARTFRRDLLDALSRSGQALTLFQSEAPPAQAATA
ncbi:MAG: hypothetical protein ACRCTM_00305 [Sphaerotilus sulfidivorans]